MGPGHKVTYAWKDTKAGTTLSREAQLSQLVQTNQEKAYTCTAQTTTAQSSFSVVLQHPCTPSTASPGKRQHLPKMGPLPVAELSLLWLAKAALPAHPPPGLSYPGQSADSQHQGLPPVQGPFPGTGSLTQRPGLARLPLPWPLEVPAHSAEMKIQPSAPFFAEDPNSSSLQAPPSGVLGKVSVLLQILIWGASSN